MLGRHRLCRTGAVVGLLAVALSWAGCTDERRHQSSEAIPVAAAAPPLGLDAGPIQVADALLRAMQRTQEIRAHASRTDDWARRYEESMSVVRGLAARARITEAVKKSRSASFPLEASEDAVVRLMTENWVSTAAHYLPGVRFESIESEQSDQVAATVSVDAENPSERARLDRLLGSAASERTGGPNGSGDQRTGRVRAAALAEGFIPSPGARIQVDLVMTADAGWRAWRVRLARSSAERTTQSSAPSITPATQPAGPPAAPGNP